MRNMADCTEWDVVVIGGGLAGLSLARQLLLYSDKRVLVLEKDATLPSPRQKVGESNVQVAGHYFAKVLDMEEHLFHQHVMKYNLRFMWKAKGKDGSDFEQFNHSAIRRFSNIACYQLDRNKFEGELLRCCSESGRMELATSVRSLEIEIDSEKAHRISFESDGTQRQVAARWVVDTTGRNRKLTGQLESKKVSEIRHSSSFFWTEGTVNIEKLTRHGLTDSKKRIGRRQLGHTPMWLATNHFMGHGFWFWVIPLHSRTSFGLVYDNDCVPAKEVSTEAGLLAWLRREFPLFNEVWEEKEIIDFGVLRTFSHDCERTIHRDRWAVSGFAGRFTDPLYSPGGDAISIYNTLIVDAIVNEGASDWEAKIAMYEQMMKVVYQSFVPTYSESYRALGDQEAFTMKYVWELTVYFGFYVFPFINDLYTDRLFLVGYFRRFGQLGELNKRLLKYIHDYYEWKRTEGRLGSPDETHFEFMNLKPLEDSEKTFYEVGVGVNEAFEVLEQQIASLKELARYFVAHMRAVVHGDPRVLSERRWVEGIELESICFQEDLNLDPEASVPEGDVDAYPWELDSQVLSRAFVEGR